MTVNGQEISHGAQRSPKRSIATPGPSGSARCGDDATLPCRGGARGLVRPAPWGDLRPPPEDVDLRSGVVRVRRNYVELLEQPTRLEKDPKSDAGKRTVTIPPHVVPVLEHHAAEFAGPDYFYVDRYGARVRSNAVYQAFVRARKKVGVEISFHDLRHTGQSLAAATGGQPRGPQEASRPLIHCCRPAVHARG